MAERRIPLTLDAETYSRVVARAATDDCTVQNVVVAACRDFVGEHQRHRAGQGGGRPETIKGGPSLSIGPGSGPQTLDMRVGVNTCRRLDERARRDGLTLHTTIVRAVKAWVGSPPHTREVVAPRSDDIRSSPAPIAPTSASPVPNTTVLQEPSPSGGASALDDTVQELVRTARKVLESVLHLSGNVLYSGVETLRPAPVYLLGLNPGGDPKDDILRKQTLSSTLDGLPGKNTNEWLDVSWRRNGIRTPPGQSLLQQRVQALLGNLGLDPRSVCSANLVFMRSPDAATSRFQEFAPLCWPVHEAILRIVQPRLIVSLGTSDTSPYGYLKSIWRPMSEDTIPSGHGDWSCRAFSSGHYRVAGIPHPGRYAIDRHPEVTRWMRRMMDDRPEVG